MHIAILGIGAIGSYIAAMFAQNTDHHLYLLARSNYLTIKEQGIVIEEVANASSSSSHRFTVVDDISKIPTCDFIILAVRESQLADLLPALKGICLNHTSIISLQNGINFEKKIQEALPAHPLYSGTCWIKVTNLALGRIRHDFGDTIKLGRYSPKDQIVPIDPADKSLKGLFEEAGLKCDLEENIQSVQLTKLALNVPFFVLMAQEGRPPVEILLDEGLNAKRQELLQEIVEAAQLYGSPIDVHYIAKIVEGLSSPSVTQAPPSQKLVEKMRVELPSNVGALLDLLESNGQKLPKLRSLYDQLLIPHIANNPEPR